MADLLLINPHCGYAPSQWPPSSPSTPCLQHWSTRSSGWLWTQKPSSPPDGQTSSSPLIASPFPSKLMEGNAPAPQETSGRRFPKVELGGELVPLPGSPGPQSSTKCLEVSQIRILTSKITQVCQDIHDIKLRWLLITQSDKEPNDITNNILTNWSDRKDTWGSNKSKPDPPDIHEGHAEDGIGYAYKIPNHLKLNNRNNQEDHERYPPQPQPIPSKMTPEPLPCPDPSEASERSSLLPTSLLSLLKKDNIEPDALSIYTERPGLSWSLCLAPANRNCCHEYGYSLQR